ncbi:MAG: regulatory iron-sulfur-containing complex subunit RicT [Actinomycetota bacterium]|jgi:cell fate regulator YaaT (PSP1 superfamily)|nr:regulatory iron-sulfur-containing complex subunit RicT [Actinomycetota bacterium]
MASIVGTIFRRNGNVYYLDCSDIIFTVGDKVICRLEEVIEIGEIVSVSNRISEDIIPSATKKIIRKATYYDMSVDELNKAKEAEGYKKFEELSKKYNLPMKLVDVHIIFDKSKMIFYFTSEKRVDFREMVKELASYFKMRIELRQIGVRDEAKIVGGLGPCGMNLCCKSFLTDFESISIKMAKDQNLPLNPLKISGICGRLMCCLKYEYESYRDFVDNAPERGMPVKCSYGKGFICGYEPLKSNVIVEFENETRVSMPLDEIEIDTERKMEIPETEENPDTLPDSFEDSYPE